LGLTKLPYLKQTFRILSAAVPTYATTRIEILADATTRIEVLAAVAAVTVAAKPLPVDARYVLNP